MDERKLLLGRCADLSRKADQRVCILTTDFLNLAEQSIVCSGSFSTPFGLDGGYPSAERKIAVFNGTGADDPSFVLPIAFLRVRAKSAGFAEKLSHRDYLGSILALGIAREKIGDILVFEDGAYLICMETISGFILDSCARIRKTDVIVSRVDSLPEKAVSLPDAVRVVVSSERIDGLISAAFRIPREKSKELVLSERVFVNGASVVRPDAELKKGDILSVRGVGRFLFEGSLSETKKGRLAVSLRVFGR